jgi:hypothetical protein
MGRYRSSSGCTARAAACSAASPPLRKYSLWLLWLFCVNSEDRKLRRRRTSSPCPALISWWMMDSIVSAADLRLS